MCKSNSSNKKMNRKLLIQRVQQLIDKLPISKKRKEAKKDLLSLKINKTCDFLSLANKYKKYLLLLLFMSFVCYVSGQVPPEPLLPPPPPSLPIDSGIFVLIGLAIIYGVKTTISYHE